MDVIYPEAYANFKEFRAVILLNRFTIISMCGFPQTEMKERTYSVSDDWQVNTIIDQSANVSRLPTLH